MFLEEFNKSTRSDIVAALRPCLDIARWIEEITDARPFSSRDDLLLRARDAASPFTAEEVERALSHHPRIGERAEGNSSEARLSRAEQEALGAAPAAVMAAILEGNRNYEEKFGQVFLIRAAGRSKEDILEALQARLSNTPDQEQSVIQQQLREIAVHRLEGMINE
jgi:2-oxo-4-hydroxy-4-carboxy-5-ureidoimidazoline decarboxylase